LLIFHGILLAFYFQGQPCIDSCMIYALTIVQVIIAVLLTIAILLQQKSGGLGAAFGGSTTVYTTKRGADLILFKATIVLSVLFFGLALVNVILA